jgi:hypothetical protein
MRDMPSYFVPNLPLCLYRKCTACNRRPRKNQCRDAGRQWNGFHRCNDVRISDKFASCEPRSPTLRQSLNLSVRYHYLNVLLCTLSAFDDSFADSLSRSFHPALGLGFERIFLKSACPENRSSCFALVFVAFALRVLTQKRLKNGSDESLWIL